MEMNVAGNTFTIPQLVRRCHGNLINLAQYGRARRPSHPASASPFATVRVWSRRRVNTPWRPFISAAPMNGWLEETHRMMWIDLALAVLGPNAPLVLGIPRVHARVSQVQSRGWWQRWQAHGAAADTYLRFLDRSHSGERSWQTMWPSRLERARQWRPMRSSTAR